MSKLHQFKGKIIGSASKYNATNILVTAMRVHPSYTKEQTLTYVFNLYPAYSPLKSYLSEFYDSMMMDGDAK